jgi:ABC-type sugar transport system substrate-binding protein
MVTAGAKGILITVADAKAENAAIAKARKAGVIVIALDSPTTRRARRTRCSPRTTSTYQYLVTGILVILAVSVDQLVHRRAL